MKFRELIAGTLGALVTILKREQEPNVSKLDALEDCVLVLQDKVDVLNKTLTDRAERIRPNQEFDDVVSAIRKRDNCSGTAAMSEARKRKVTEKEPDAVCAQCGLLLSKFNARSVARIGASAAPPHHVEKTQFLTR